MLLPSAIQLRSLSLDLALDCRSLFPQPVRVLRSPREAFPHGLKGCRHLSKLLQQGVKVSIVRDRLM